MGHTEEEHLPVDRAIMVVVPEADAELVGAVLMDRLGPFSQESLEVIEASAADASAGAVPEAAPEAAAPADAPGAATADAAQGDPAAIPGDTSFVALTFYPESAGLAAATVGEVIDLIPDEIERVYVDICDVDRGWQEGWKDHFTPLVIGTVRVRPPWEEEAEPPLIDVVIDPGMGFGTGLHPTTRGTLGILQGPTPEAGGARSTMTSNALPQVWVPEEWADPGSAAAKPAPVVSPGGGLVDVGTGSGILAIAAAKLGWDPILAFDNDPVALEAAAENVEANGVGGVVRLMEGDIAEVDLAWFDGATVLANLTLEPVVVLLKRLAGQPLPARLIVSGIMGGEQEVELLLTARASGLRPGRRVYEAEWVSLELVPIAGDDFSDGMGAGSVRAPAAAQARRPDSGR